MLWPYGFGSNIILPTSSLFQRRIQVPPPIRKKHKHGNQAVQALVEHFKSLVLCSWAEHLVTLGTTVGSTIGSMSRVRYGRSRMRLNSHRKVRKYFCYEIGGTLDSHPRANAWKNFRSGFHMACGACSQFHIITPDQPEDGVLQSLTPRARSRIHKIARPQLGRRRVSLGHGSACLLRSCFGSRDSLSMGKRVKGFLRLVLCLGGWPSIGTPKGSICRATGVPFLIAVRLQIGCSLSGPGGASFTRRIRLGNRWK